jgi:hypothetical protein
MIKSLALLAILIGATAGAAFAGGDPDLPAPSRRGEWRMLTSHDETTTSQCIGNPETPLCAVESLLACLWRRDETACLAARTPEDSWVSPNEEAVRRAKSVIHPYRVIGARRIRRDEFRPDLQGLSDQECWSPQCQGRRLWRLGDVRIVMEEKWCEPRNSPPSAVCEPPERRCWNTRRGEHCEIANVHVIYIVQKRPDGWKVVDTFWRDDDRRQHLDLGP